MWAEHLRLPNGRSDFSGVWYGAKLLFDHRNPYLLIGPGREISFDYELHYPVTALVAAFPLTMFGEHTADLIFVTLSAGLLAYGVTKENWNRIWIFPSSAFVIAARSAQFSPLIAATIFLPSMGWLLAVKPSIGLAALSLGSRRKWISTIIGGLILSGIGFLLLPAWPQAWLANISGSWEYTPPASRLGGAVLVLAMLRWKQPEARFLLLLALIPQVSSWYEGLLPMFVGRTKREFQVLSLVSSFGYILLIPLALISPNQTVSVHAVGRLMVAFCYLPALVVILRRPYQEAQQT